MDLAVWKFERRRTLSRIMRVANPPTQRLEVVSKER